jgi:outer membrane cobalamin receptor
VNPVRILVLTAFVTVAAWGFAPPVMAAEVNSELGPLIVTATRRAEPLLDHAGSLIRLTAEELSALGATHHSEAMNRVPGTYIQRGSGQESLTAIRSPVLTGPGSCGAFLFLENGIPIRPTGFCNVNELFEVNSEQAQEIEIVRGPGSALYGSDAVHGTINVLMPAPAELPRFGISAEGRPDEYLRGRLTTSRAGETTDVGLLGHWTHDGGWREESGFEEAKLNAGLTHRAGSGQLDMMLAATNLNQETAGFIQGLRRTGTPSWRNRIPTRKRTPTRTAHDSRCAGRRRATHNGNRCGSVAQYSARNPGWPDDRRIARRQRHPPGRTAL